MLLICGSSLTLISYFFLILDNFQNASVILNIPISAKWQPKIKTNISKFKLAHWQSKHISFLKNPLLLCISHLIKQEYFFGLPSILILLPVPKLYSVCIECLFMKVGSFQCAIQSLLFPYYHRLVLHVHLAYPFICISHVLSCVFQVHLDCIDCIFFRRMVIFPQVSKIFCRIVKSFAE